MHQLTTFGEAMIRFSPPRHEQLEQASAFQVHVGGSELNAAVAAARMGLSTSYVTRLTRNSLGYMIENRAREHGVNTENIEWTNEDRVGTYYIEFGASPRANRVLYDRAGSAMSQISGGTIDWDSIFAGSALFFTSGITPALSSSAAEATFEAVEAACACGITVCVDLNFRAKLWSEGQARLAMTRIMESTDILFATEEDTMRVFGIQEDSYEEAARKLADRFHLRMVAITLRENPSVWRNTWTAIVYEAETNQIHRAPSYNIEVVDRVGSGDSFVGGFLYGHQKGGASLGIRYGVALSALKQTMPGDLSWASREDVERLLDSGNLRIVR